MQEHAAGRLRRRFIRLVISGMGPALLAGLTPPAIQAADEIAEIVVTARKVEERIADIPLAITAFGEKEIQAAGIDSLEDVAAFTPGLSFFNPVGGFLPTPVIRGVAPTDIFGEVSTAIFVDGVYVSGREGLNFSQLDFERIEVVKGPQSALYGRNAFSGAINYITKRPTADFEATTEVQAGNRGKLVGKGMISGPIIGETLLGRVSAAYDEWDGSYDNPIPDGPDVGGYTYQSLQGSLLWNASDAVQVTLAGYYSNDEIDDSTTVAQQADCENDTRTEATNDERLLNVCGDVLDLGSLYKSIGSGLADDEIRRIVPAVGEERDLVRSSLRIDWDTSFGAFNALTGYSSTEQTALVDGGFGLGYDVPFVYETSPNCLPFAEGLYGCPDPLEADPSTFELGRLHTGELEDVQGDDTTEISQEIRFTSPLDRPFRYSAGGYIYQVELDSRDTGVVATYGAIPEEQRLGFFASLDGSSNALTIGDAIFREWFGPNGDVDPRVTAEEDTNGWATFAWTELDFQERFTARAELRYTDETKELTQYQWGDPDTTLGDAALKTRTVEDDWDAWTGRLSLKYQVSDDWQAYTSVARGVKSGGFDSDNVEILDDPDTIGSEAEEDAIIIVPFDTEEILAYELGIKGQSEDGRVRIDMAMFRNNWDDVVVPQVFNYDPTRGSSFEFDQPTAFNDNAGDATIWGWEMSLDVVPADNWLGRLTLSYTDATWDSAKIVSFAKFPSYRAPGCESEPTDPVEAQACDDASGDVSGNQLQRQPPWQVSGSLTHRRAVWSDWEYFSRLDVSWEDEWYSGNENQAVVPDHTNVNLRIGLESSRYEVELWVKNLLEEDAPTAAFRQPYFNNTDDILAPGNPERSTSYKIFPWALIVSHPDLRTFGLTARVKFGGAQD